MKTDAQRLDATERSQHEAKPPSTRWRVTGKDVARILGLAAVYFALGKLGLLFSFMRPSLTSVWPPSGIAVAGLLVFGYRVWPGAFLGALAVALTTPCDVPTSLLLAITNTLESLAGAWLANRFANGRNFFRHPWDVVKYAVLVGMITPLLSPPLGVRVVSLDHFILWAGDAAAGLTWWLGDVVSLVVLTPLILVWGAKPRHRLTARQKLEFALLVLVLAAVGEAVFGRVAPESMRGYLLPYLCLPMLFWVAFRFREREMITATFVLGGVVMWDTLHGYGMFTEVEPNKDLLVYQGFLAVASVMSLCLAAVVGQRRDAAEELQGMIEDLDRRVQQRTAALQAEVAERKRIEEALRINLTKYAVLFESFPLGISVTDEQGRILEANHASTELLGVTKSEHAHRQINGAEWQIIRPNRAPMPPEEYASVRALKERRRVENVEMGIVKSDDRVTWLSVTAEPLPLKGYGVVVTYSDITQRRHAEEVLQRSEATLRGILDAAKESIWLFSREGTILKANATAQERFGALAGAVVGKRFEEIMPEDLARTRRARVSEVFESGRPLQFEDQREGVQFHHSLYPVFDAERRVASVACFSRDITELKRAEQALQEANRKLQAANRNLETVTEELRVANETLERRVAEQTTGLREANRVLRMISECNRALVCIADEQQLIQEICRIVVEIGGFKMAWVGSAEADETRSVRPVAAVGLAAGYLDKIRVCWADNPLGQGPTGTAIRTGKACVGRDFLSQGSLTPWREMALAHGFRSSVALPLSGEGRVFGALTIYSAEPDAFDEKQIEVLSELAEDMAFGITALRAHAERDQARGELEQKAAQLRALSAELIRAEARERRHLAQILHDSLQQLLVGTRYNVELLRKQGEAADAEATFRRIDELLGQCIRISRSLTAELSPPILYEAGLASALRWLGRWFQETHGLTVQVAVQEELLADPEDIRVTLFQAVRELLFNVVKHAKVEAAEVSAALAADGRFRIMVSDQGAGFDPARLRSRRGKAGGFGLFSLRERLEMLGGKLEIESAPGRGSRFTVAVSLAPQRAPGQGGDLPTAASQASSAGPAA